MTPEAFEAAVRTLFAEVAAMTLATCAQGRPWASDVYFAPDGWKLVFFSSPASRHCRNLEANPACAATIHPVVASWRDIHGLQLEGRVEPVEGLIAMAQAAAVYCAKFPFAKALLEAPGESAAKMARVRPHVFIPQSVRLTDNRQGFGTRFLLRLHDGRPLGPPERDSGN
ncbi:pyridoxamine 5'-phosphate oxidase family protein [Solidesulfovibrio magneticus]|uniref:Pyridoxamine 5'-phosphate oxidase N-terminal domain-containing protein n=1 Tax=Solidesulfovibrio magneticus (strain ATCC 700980 / DSM 13731 / RS-1) TaxID=573370 RepID=C4XKA8_SOLM1|nr:pyridoxamine 5'-phosphate oxidase family protein [Solidesulfovibrio magneticus]BAH76848.1 hypothetical protein DMR_33570 [Solidesulfovibrio magneticus RS-1]